MADGSSTALVGMTLFGSVMARFTGVPPESGAIEIVWFVASIQ